MASENVTTIATLPGVMESIQAAGGEFVISSNLFQACQIQVADNAEYVNWKKYPVPSAVSVATDANAVTPGAITIAQAQATIAMYASATRVSRAALLGGRGIPDDLRNIMVNNVAAGVDKAIAAIATEANFTATPIANCTTSAAFREGVYKLRNTGYRGPLRAFVTEYMAYKISEDDRNFWNPMTNDAIVSNGYQGRSRIGGVDIFTIPSSLAPTATTSSLLNGLMWMHPFGIGVGYHPGDGGGLMHADVAKPMVFDDVLGIAAFIGMDNLSATGGILLLSDSATE
jgi:hypothetical protein